MSLLIREIDRLLGDFNEITDDAIMHRLIAIRDMARDYALPAGFGDVIPVASFAFNPHRPQDVPSSEDIPENVRKYLDSSIPGRYVYAVKEARQIIPGGLKEAKDTVDMWIAKFYPNFHS